MNEEEEMGRVGGLAGWLVGWLVGYVCMYVCMSVGGWRRREGLGLFGGLRAAALVGGTLVALVALVALLWTGPWRPGAALGVVGALVVAWQVYMQCSTTAPTALVVLHCRYGNAGRSNPPLPAGCTARAPGGLPGGRAAGGFSGRWLSGGWGSDRAP